MKVVPNTRSNSQSFRDLNGAIIETLFPERDSRRQKTKRCVAVQRLKARCTYYNLCLQMIFMKKLSITTRLCGNRVYPIIIIPFTVYLRRFIYTNYFTLGNVMLY